MSALQAIEKEIESLRISNERLSEKNEKAMNALAKERLENIDLLERLRAKDGELKRLKRELERLRAMSAGVTMGDIQGENTTIIWMI